MMMNLILLHKRLFNVNQLFELNSIGLAFFSLNILTKFVDCLGSNFAIIYVNINRCLD